MRKLFAAVLLIVGFQAHAQTTFPVTSYSQFQTQINAASASSGGGIVVPAAGTYTNTTTLSIPCTANAVSIIGPTTAFPSTYSARPTVTLVSSITNGWQIAIQACTTARTIKYLALNGNQPTGGGGGGIFVGAQSANFDIEDNYIYGLWANVSTGHEYDGAIWLDGAHTGGGTGGGTVQVQSNYTIQWNVFGSDNLSDCNAIFHLTTYQGGGYNSSGGNCNGVGISAGTTNGKIWHNVFQHLEQGLKNFECAGNFPASCVYTDSSLDVEFNTFFQWHRIATESQHAQDATHPMQFNNNLMNEAIAPGFGCFAASLPNGGSYVTNENGNTAIISTFFDGSAPPSSATEGTCSPAFEYWGNGTSTANNNFVQGVFNTGITWGFGAANWDASNNIMQLAGGYTAGAPPQPWGAFCIGNEGEQPSNGPTQTNNSCSVNTSASQAATNVVSRRSSVTPTFSPMPSGTYGSPVSVTINDTGYTANSGPQGSHSTYYTLDGSTPTVNSTYCGFPSCTVSVTPGQTLKAIGMWGDPGMAHSTYTANYGWGPSTVLSATYPAGGIFNVPAGSSTATIQSTINSASAFSASPATVVFAAGTYNITSQINIPCPASPGLTIIGPTPTGAPTNLSTGAGATWPISPTAILNGNLGVNWGFTLSSGGACTKNVTFQYLEWNGGAPAGGGGGFLFVPQGTGNLTVWWNYIHGNGATQITNHEQDTLIWMDGGPTGARDANPTFLWNRFGQANGPDCAGLMNVIGGAAGEGGVPGCVVTLTSPDGPGGYVAGTGPGLGRCFYQGGQTEKDGGGYCSAVGIHVNTDNFTFNNNSVSHQEQGLKFYLGGTTPPNIYTPTNVNINNNDWNQIHRIIVEAQHGSGPWSFQNNSEHDMALFGGVSWGYSGPQLGGAQNINNNVMALSSSNSAKDKYGYGSAGSEGIELWATNSTANNNIIQGAWSGGVQYGFDTTGMQVNNNTFSYGGANPANCVGNEEGQSPPPSQSGNTCNSTIVSVTSTAPTISPTSGGAPLTVTLTDAGKTSGPQPLGNTGIWYTTDGSTPVPATGTAKYLPSGGTFTMASAGTVKAVGMWGAMNQPGSYASSYGFVPSSVASVTFTGGGVTLTSMSMTCAFSSVNIAGTSQCAVQCFYSNGTNDVCTNGDGLSTPGYSSTVGSIAGISSSALVTGISAGTTNVFATVGGVNSNLVPITVNPALVIMKTVGRRANFPR